MNIRLATFQIAVFRRSGQGGEYIVECLINNVTIKRERYPMRVWDTPTEALRDFCSKLEVNARD